MNRAILACLSLTLLANDAYQAKLAKDQQITHALNRLTFGARPGDVEAVKKLGLKKWIDRQLHPETIAENPKLTEKLAELKTISLSAPEMAAAYPPPQVIKAMAEGKIPMPTEGAEREQLAALVTIYKRRNQGSDEKLTPAQRKSLLLSPPPGQTVAAELVEAKVYRATYSERQLQEVLADFWFNHFNVYLDKGADRYLTTSYERDAIRPFVLGKFRDLLRATATHPAMLFYLDNWQSTTAAKGRAKGLNENYARELMELHTLGVDGGYTQQDVIEVARCFTGWTIRAPSGRGGRAGIYGGEFFFNPRLHDTGEKTVLGVKIPAGGGQQDGERVLEILAHHPSTSRYLARKLALRFVADEPPAALVERLAAKFRATDGDLGQVMATLFESKEFWSQGAYQSKMKSPLELVVSAVRAAGAEVERPLALANLLKGMGQPLYRKQEPTGYSNNGEDWTNSASLLARLNFATALEANKVPGLRAASLPSALNLRAPEFQKR
ncbi:MAG: DUF1800 domain-containing protein [Bryobacteraceae bacterium]|nr:DUF1800 domain-containing protein [Bryobacteraceae bacterium]